MSETSLEFNTASVHAVATYDTIDQGLEDERLDGLLERLSIQEPAEKKQPKERSYEQIQALHQSDRLLVRGMPSNEYLDPIFSGERPSLGAYRKETELMRSQEGLKNTSCTLLIPREEGAKQVGTYTSSGFLLNANTATIQHISTQDSNSATTENGELSAGNAHRRETLDALVHDTRNNNVLDHSSYNEVKGIFHIDDVEGLYYTTKIHNDPAQLQCHNRTQMRAIQALYKEKYQLDLPFVEYNLNTGKITPVPTDKLSIQMDVLGTVSTFPNNCRKIAKDTLFSELKVN
ncbi:MAG: hypothetical protein H7A38_03730 [Chlamydiales bacterium]|nr:hypothetical protein [Chlamydiales bacterium]